MEVTAQSPSSFRIHLDAIPAETQQKLIHVTAHLADGTTLPVATKQVTVKRIPADTIAISGVTAIGTLNTPHSYAVTFSNATGATPNVPVKSWTVETDLLQSVLKATKTDDTHFSLTMLSMPSSVVTATITVKATLGDDTVITNAQQVTLKVVPTATINGASAFEAKNGGGSSEYNIDYSPVQYNASVAIKSIATNSSQVTVAPGYTKDGFTLVANGTTTDLAITVTAVITIDGTDRTINKSVSVTYKEGPLEYEGVDLALPSGRIWATANVGASSPEKAGLYFQWGDIVGYGSNTSDGKQFNWANYKFAKSTSPTFSKYNTTSSYGTVDDKTTLESADDAATQNMGPEWRMPDSADFDELLNTANCTNEWTTVNGVYGRKFTSVRNGKTLFFPAAGYRSSSSLLNVGSGGCVWSRSLYSGGPYGAWGLDFDSGNCGRGDSGRYVGYSVRGVQ